MGTIGERLKRLRQENKLTQSQVAEVIGITYSSVSRYEKNSAIPTYENLVTLSELFNVRVEEIIGELDWDLFLQERKCGWSNAKVISEFNKYRHGGNDITDKGIRKNYSALRSQIIKRFGSYRNFLNELGLNYEQIRINVIWTEEKVKEEFEILLDKGEEVNPSSLKEKHGPLIGAIERFFGSYKKFLESVGIDYTTISSYQKWNKEKVISEFNKYRNDGNDITDKGLRKKHPTLRTQIIKRFGSYGDFLNELGINYEQIRLNIVWTKETVKEEFKTLLDKEEKVSHSSLKENHSSLLGAIERFFGSYKKFLESIGIDYATIRLYQEWDKEKVILEFKEYASNTDDLRESTLQDNYPALYKQIRNYFSTYGNFLAMLGYDYSNIRGKIEWTNEKIEQEFKEYVQAGYDLRAKSMHKIHTNLYDAIKRNYGQYGAYLEAKGFNYSDIRGNIEWTDEKVKEEYLELIKMHGGKLSITGISLKDNKLYQQIRKRFRSYKSFLQSMGLSESDIYCILRIDQELGLSFELLIKEMFERLEFKHEYQFRGIKGIRPDFYIPDSKEIIDVKLSAYTGFKSYTPQKYLRHCSKLTFIYLRGEPIEHDFENLHLIPIDNYYSVLKEKGYYDLIHKFEKLKQQLS